MTDKMYIVCYYDWEDAGWNSVWFSENKAQERADLLNKDVDMGWIVEEVEVGD